MGRSPGCSKEGLNRGAWTAVEDEILASYVRSHGEGKWSRLPKRAGLKRCGKSCRLRWLNYLRPDIKRGNISEQEEDLIIRLHKLLGNRWSLIAGRLPGRTDNEIKNYWNTTLWKKVQGRPLRSPKPNRTMKDNQRKPTARKLLAEVAPEPPMRPSESAEDVTRANFTTCNEHVPHHDRQLVAPFNGGQALNPATAKVPAISGKSSLPDHTSNDLITGLDLSKDMCTWCPPESSIVLVDDGAGEEARNGAGGEEGNGYKEAAMPDNSHGMLLDRAALGGWLEADISQSDPFSLSDLQLLASFLNLEEWQL